MHKADKAVLRLAIGLGLAVLAAFGLALRMPFLVCVMAVIVLCKPGPPIPFLKGVGIAPLPLS
jgi:lipopolysaccharide/colanic/teichoic acid biosynthesis glycosyltransferase